MNFLIIGILLFFSFEAYSEIENLNASIEVIEVDSAGYYSKVSLYNEGQLIGLSGASADYPNCVAYSSDFGISWNTIDRIEKPDFNYEYFKYYINFKDIYFNNESQLIIFSDMNKFFLYGINPLEKDEYLLDNVKSFEDGRKFDFMLSQRKGDEYYVYSRSNSIFSYNDYSSITILNTVTKERKNIPFDMKKFQKLTDGRRGERDQRPWYDDEFLTKDKCFFTTISNFIEAGVEYPILTRSLVKITDFDNPQWEVVNLRFSDSSAKHYIYFDDCQNGFLSTYKTNFQEYPRLYKTTDGGDTWEKIFEDNGVEFILKDFKRANDSTLFALSDGYVFYKSTNNGYKWKQIVSDYKRTTTDYEIIDENTLLIAYNRNSLAKLTISKTTGIVETGLNEDLNFSLPYPQPANSEVRIDYDYSQKTRLNISEISIVDLLGKSLTNPIIRIENNSIIWDCSSAQPGVYIINIKHGTEEKSVKVIVE